MRMFVTAALLAALVLPALAGEISGFRCDNACPLATTANTHRSFGLESRSVSSTARADVATAVLANLAKV